MKSKTLHVYQLEHIDYLSSLSAMQAFTLDRDDHAVDELWLMQHPAVYTQGVAGKPEHLIASTQIPVIQSDRGGQITYHGPGQLIAYPLLDLNRLQLNMRELVTTLEDLSIALLAELDIKAIARRDAPGIYVDENKIASLGLRIKKGRSYHGLALNIDMDLSPFENIHPCGLVGMKMTQISALIKNPDFNLIQDKFISHFIRILGYTDLYYFNQHPLL